jgi:hypothetical protein
VADGLPGLADGLVGMQVNFFVLDLAPDQFDEHVVAPAALSIHADGDALLLQSTDEGLACKLTTFVGVEDLRSFIH